MPKLSKEQYETIYKICERAEALNASDTGRMVLVLDLSNVAQKYEIDLDELLNFPDYDFVHDISGIQKHFNRSSMVFENRFVPRSMR